MDAAIARARRKGLPYPRPWATWYKGGLSNLTVDLC